MAKRLRNLKKCLKKRRGELKKNEVVFIEVQLETGCYFTVVQRFKVAFSREIWLPVPVLYPGDLALLACLLLSKTIIIQISYSYS